jgi:hypothetical protein
LFFVTVAVAVMGLALGCGGSEKAETSAQGESAATEEVADASQEPVASAKLKAPETQMELASIDATGKLGCGHCTFEVIDECSLALQDAEGEVYLIEAGDRQDELMEKRYDELTAAISGRVAEVNGQKVIYTDSVELR